MAPDYKPTPKLREIPFQPSTLETVDYAVTNWLKGIRVHTTTSKGFKPVPVLWVAAERSFSVKNDPALRDSGGSMKLPLLSVERTSVTKDPSRKGTAWGNVPAVNDYKGGSITIARRIQQDKSAAFASAKTKDIFGQKNFPYKNNQVVYETITIPMPVYIEVTYNLTCRTEYQQQMNQIVQPFITRTGGVNYFTVRHDGHRFEAFMADDFTLESNIAEMGEDQRYYQTTFDVKILAYLIGAAENQDTPKTVIRENAVQVYIGSERVILDDDIEHPDSKNRKPGVGGKYRG
ncbi:MAG TPA: hypothetical protein EYN38_07675 [Flavobacteriales bacterium]|nr:hypothetical protein [Flavobacteriales bacterium]